MIGILLILYCVCGSTFSSLIPQFDFKNPELLETTFTTDSDLDSKSSTLPDLHNKYEIENEKFHTLYLNNFQQKLTQIFQIVNEMNINLKSLQEKAHVWDLYRHHIDAWDDHMKSLDHKIDLIKHTQDDTKSIENKLNSIEFTINHILNKIVLIDTKPSSSFLPSPLNIENRSQFDNIQEILIQLTGEKAEHKQILKRLNNILRHIVSVENINRREQIHLNPNPKIAELMHPIGKEIDNKSILIRIESKLDNFIKNIPSIKDIKQIGAIGRKNTKSLDDILEVVNSVADRTIRLFDAESHHSGKYLNVCQSTANELSTFTESSDLLLKRIETLVLNIKEKVEKISVTKEIDDPDSLLNYNENTEQTITETTLLTTLVENSYTNESLNSIESDDSTESTITEFNQPFKKGCHDLTVRIDGVYVFSEISDLNSAKRNFNERYCTFPTDGPGWTVIQRRGPYDYQENFNRTWNEYRNGFGSLAKDFWFGNEFMHRIVYKDTYELRIELEDFHNQRVWAEYSIFQIDSEKLNYNLLIGGYKGAVPDSMLYHHNQDFSTYDRRNDKSVDLCCSCATGYGSGWWFDNCAESNLNGIYHTTPYGHNYIGILWENWQGDYSLKKTRMLIRPKSFNEFDDLEMEFPDDP